MNHRVKKCISISAQFRDFFCWNCFPFHENVSAKLCFLKLCRVFSWLHIFVFTKFHRHSLFVVDWIASQCIFRESNIWVKSSWAKKIFIQSEICSANILRPWKKTDDSHACGFSKMIRYADVNRKQLAPLWLLSGHNSFSFHSTLSVWRHDSQ